MASIMLAGNTCSSTELTVGAACWMAVSDAVGASFNPAPGRTRFTAARPRKSATVVTASKYKIAFRPMRPMRFKSPEPALPYTRVPKLSGAMMDRISRRKMLLTGASRLATPGAAIPITIPAAIPMKIHAVSESRFTARPI